MSWKQWRYRLHVMHSVLISPLKLSSSSNISELLLEQATQIWYLRHAFCIRVRAEAEIFMHQRSYVTLKGVILSLESGKANCRWHAHPKHRIWTVHHHNHITIFGSKKDQLSAVSSHTSPDQIIMKMGMFYFFSLLFRLILRKKTKPVPPHLITWSSFQSSSDL